MSTILDLEATGALVRYDAGLYFDQQELRRIYLMPRARDWMRDTLPGLASTWNIEASPLEQLDDLLSTFCAGEPLAIGHRVKCLDSLGEGIWELKTADVRMFGWFPKKDFFINTDCDLKRNIVERRMYQAYCAQAVRFRDGIGLDAPNFIPGEDPLNVVSDFYYP